MSRTPLPRGCEHTFLNPGTPLTPDQDLLLGALRGHFALNGNVPLIREVADAFRLDPNRAALEVRRLLRAGYIRSLGNPTHIRDRAYSLTVPRRAA